MDSDKEQFSQKKAQPLNGRLPHDHFPADPVSLNGTPAPSAIPSASAASSSTWQAEQSEPTRDNGRFLAILTFFAQIIIHVVFYDLFLTRIPLLGQSVRASRPRRFRRWSRRFRLLALEMGGVLIKLGQFLSSRVDVLPIEVTEELMGLQDEVTAEAPWRLFAAMEADLGPISAHFAHLEEKPLAAASLGQTHRAWLHSMQGEPRGEAVVVKIQRPGIERIVKTDLAALEIVARWLMRYRPIRRRANVPALMNEFGHTLWEELDYRAEVENLKRFATIHAADPQIYIPRVMESLCSDRIIVMENVESIKIMQTDEMKKAGINPGAVAQLLLETYFKQIFKEGFFHADPHPGNLFVTPDYSLPWSPSQNEDGSLVLDRPFLLVFVDFGMVGRVPEIQADLLSKVMLSIAQQDARALTEAYNALGFFLPNADLERIEAAQSEILERIYGRNLLDLARPDPEELKELGDQFRDLLFDFPLQIPQDFIYLGRAMGIVSGLVSQLDQEINPWFFIEKFSRELIQEQAAQQIGVEAVWQFIRPYLETPARLQQILVDAENGRFRVQSVPDKALLRHQEKMEKRLAQLSWSILGAAGLVSGTLFFLRRTPPRQEKDS